jgi:hypothetical protein
VPDVTRYFLWFLPPAVLAIFIGPAVTRRKSLMLSITRQMLFTFALLAILGSGSRAQEKKPGEALVGSWRADIADGQAVLLEVRGATVEMKVESNGAATSVWAGKLSFPKENADRHFDWVEIKAGDRALPDNKCLYKLSGDTLLVIGGGPSERPTKLLSGPGPGLARWSLLGWGAERVAHSLFPFGASARMKRGEGID